MKEKKKKWPRVIRLRNNPVSQSAVYTTAEELMNQSKRASTKTGRINPELMASFQRKSSGFNFTDLEGQATISTMDVREQKILNSTNTDKMTFSQNRRNSVTTTRYSMGINKINLEDINLASRVSQSSIEAGLGSLPGRTSALTSAL